MVINIGVTTSILIGLLCQEISENYAMCTAGEQCSVKSLLNLARIQNYCINWDREDKNICSECKNQKHSLNTGLPHAVYVCCGQDSTTMTLGPESFPHEC